MEFPAVKIFYSLLHWSIIILSKVVRNYYKTYSNIDFFLIGIMLTGRDTIMIFAKKHSSFTMKNNTKNIQFMRKKRFLTHFFTFFVYKYTAFLQNLGYSDTI